MKTIKYPSLTWFTGRNGLFKSSGIKIFTTYDNDKHIHLIPLTSKGKDAHCDIVIHSQSIPDVMLSISEQSQNNKSINSDPLHEVAMIAAIMGDNCFDKAKKAFHKGGYIDTVELMGRWAIEFYRKYKDFDWEQLYEKPVMEGINNKVGCWDEAIIEFTLQKIESL
jgi:hypothetical protein